MKSASTALLNRLCAEWPQIRGRNVAALPAALVRRRNRAVHNSFAESGLRQTNFGKREVNAPREARFPMKTAAEYRAMAEECFKWAREAKANEVRVSLKQLAQVWLDAAAKLDGLPPTRTQSAPDAA